MNIVAKPTDLFTEENNRLLIDDYHARFEIDSYLMSDGELPAPLRKAAVLLKELAEEGYTDQWRDISESDKAIAAQAAALRICYTALAEMECFVRRLARNESEWHQKKIDGINKSGVKA